MKGRYFQRIITWPTRLLEVIYLHDIRFSCKIEVFEMLFSVQIALMTPVIFVILYLVMNWLIKTDKNICILVLGDIGRSPRIQYHALSFAKKGFQVTIVGYVGMYAIPLYDMNRHKGFIT